MNFMRIRSRGVSPRAALVFALGVAWAAIVSANPKSQPSQQTDKQYQQLIRSLDGPDLFHAYCASCHGLDAKGHGPAAIALKTPVPDLTHLASNSGGKFPDARVRKTIMGDDVIASHGSREMPVWGPIFHQVEEDVDRGNVRLENLVKYLESIQAMGGANASEKPRNIAPPAETSPSGAQLFRRHCAACHGNDLKGNGPAPAPFQDRTPDLTTLAKRHDGKFPDAYVVDVLHNGVAISAHGPAEMPIWGTTFKESERLSSAQIDDRITKLTAYLKSMQAK